MFSLYVQYCISISICICLSIYLSVYLPIYLELVSVISYQKLVFEQDSRSWKLQNTLSQYFNYEVSRCGLNVLKINPLKIIHLFMSLMLPFDMRLSSQDLSVFHITSSPTPERLLMAFYTQFIWLLGRNPIHPV